MELRFLSRCGVVCVTLGLGACGQLASEPPTLQAVSRVFAELGDVRVTRADTNSDRLGFTLDSLRTPQDLQRALRAANLEPRRVTLEVFGPPNVPRASNITAPLQGRLVAPPAVRSGETLPLFVTLTNTGDQLFRRTFGACSVSFALLNADTGTPVQWSSQSLPCILAGMQVEVPPRATCLYPTSYTGVPSTTLGGQPLPPGRYVLRAALMDVEDRASGAPGAALAFEDAEVTVVARDATLPNVEPPAVATCTPPAP